MAWSTNFRVRPILIIAAIVEEIAMLLVLLGAEGELAVLVEILVVVAGMADGHVGVGPAPGVEGAKPALAPAVRFPRVAERQVAVLGVAGVDGDGAARAHPGVDQPLRRVDHVVVRVPELGRQVPRHHANGREALSDPPLQARSHLFADELAVPVKHRVRVDVHPISFECLQERLGRATVGFCVDCPLLGAEGSGAFRIPVLAWVGERGGGMIGPLFHNSGLHRPIWQ